MFIMLLTPFCMENSNAHLLLAPENPYILDKNSKSPHMNILNVYCLQLRNDVLLTSIIKQLLTSISSIKMFYLVFEMVKCCMEVGDTVPSCEVWTELGVAILTIWKFILNVPPPLSPPIFIHTSLAGMNPSCQVSLLVLHEKLHVKMLNFAMVCLSKLITSNSLLRGGQPLQPAL